MCSYTKCPQTVWVLLWVALPPAPVCMPAHCISPPTRQQNFGGNIDNRRIGKGATMYYPVQVEGALLSMGDAHAAQGKLSRLKLRLLGWETLPIQMK